MNYSIDRYLNVKQAYMPSFSSDGRRLAFISDLTGVPQAWRVPLGAPSCGVPMPEQLTFAEDRVLWLRCSPAPATTAFFSLATAAATRTLTSTCSTPPPASRPV